MKKIFLFFIMIVLICAIVGCGTSYSQAVQDERFEVTYRQQENGETYINIIKDKETGKQYLWRQHCNAGGLCELD